MPIRKWKTTRQDVLFAHKFVRVVADTITYADESRTYHYLESPVASVASVALTGAGEIVLTRQYRHPVGEVIYDLPAGRALPGEDLFEAARRELREETGYSAATMQELVRVSPFPGSIKVEQVIFLATGLTPGQQDLDPEEELETHLVPFERIYQEVLTGQHIDGALQMGVLMARAQGLT